MLSVHPDLQRLASSLFGDQPFVSEPASFFELRTSEVISRSVTRRKAKAIREKGKTRGEKGKGKMERRERRKKTFFHRHLPVQLIPRSRFTITKNVIKKVRFDIENPPETSWKFIPTPVEIERHKDGTCAFVLDDVFTPEECAVRFPRI
jgi:hypothetical protein